MKKFYKLNCPSSEQTPSWKNVKEIVRFSKAAIILFIILLNVTVLHAQTTFIPTVSGGWDGAKIQGLGYQDYGSGAVRLLDGVNNGCEGAAVYETTDKYDPCSGNFNKCYQVVFGCDDNGADGLAFTFSNCALVTDYQVWGCGGGLGYVDACSNNKGITIEFDTFNNGGADVFDTGYEGTGTQDQVAIHKNMQAKTGLGKVTGVAIANLEDGQQHTVCINYNNTSHVLSATIDGVTAISYDLDLASLDLQTYFGGCGGLNQSWSAGTNGAFNAQAVSNGASLYNSADKICPQMLPLEFLSISAKAKSSSVLVSWSTVNEKSNKKFIVERSSDLSNWETIGEVAGAGNSTSILEYNYMDNAALIGTSYYRIRQVDFDGTYAHSKIVSVKTFINYINILPNPFDDAFAISSDIKGNVTVNIYDVLGRLVYSVIRENNDGLITIEPELASGAYMVAIQTDTFIEQLKIIKK